MENNNEVVINQEIGLKGYPEREMKVKRFKIMIK